MIFNWRFKRATILVILILFLGLKSFCQSSTENEGEIQSIQDEINICVENSKTTDRELKECKKLGIIELDKLLNKVYKDILPYLKKEDINGFKNNQRKWLDFYNTEVAFNNTVMKSKFHGGNYEFGTLVEVEMVDRQYQILKNRVETLMRYLVIFETGL